MVYQEINESFAKHEFEYRELPVELFINQSTYEELLRTPYLKPEAFFAHHKNPVSRVFGCLVYVVVMDEKFIWLAKSDLVSLAESKNTLLEENWDYIPVTRINRSKEKIQINIPRVIRDFEYSQD